MTDRLFTLITPYYENPGMLREQQRQWRALPAEVRSALHVVVVDDGSPVSPAQAVIDAETIAALASFRLFRAKVDVRWNWIFCRNLGVAHATTDWVLMTDMDHVVPADTWVRLTRGKLDRRRAYRLSRVTAPDMVPVPPHPNTWVMTREMFHRVGGYDERFSGVYGSDGHFHGLVSATAAGVDLLPEVAVVYHESVIADACTTTYARKEPSDREQRDRIRAEIRALGTTYAPKTLTFPWEQIL